MAISLLPDNASAWTYRSWNELMAIPREERERLQLEAMKIQFHRLRNRIPALKKLADRQGVRPRRVQSHGCRRAGALPD